MQIEKPLRQSSKWLSGSWKSSHDYWHPLRGWPYALYFVFYSRLLREIYLGNIYAKYVHKSLILSRVTLPKLFDMQKIERQNFTDKQSHGEKYFIIFLHIFSRANFSYQKFAFTILWRLLLCFHWKSIKHIENMKEYVLFTNLTYY